MLRAAATCLIVRKWLEQSSPQEEGAMLETPDGICVVCEGHCCWMAPKVALALQG